MKTWRTHAGKNRWRKDRVDSLERIPKVGKVHKVREVRTYAVLRFVVREVGKPSELSER